MFPSGAEFRASRRYLATGWPVGGTSLFNFDRAEGEPKIHAINCSSGARASPFSGDGTMIGYDQNGMIESYVTDRLAGGGKPVELAGHAYADVAAGSKSFRRATKRPWDDVLQQKDR